MNKKAAAIIGWGHTRFTKHADATVESLMVEAIDEALTHAGVEPREVDQAFVGHFNAGFSAQDFTASLVLQASDDMRFIPVTRVENACATGSAALYAGLDAVDSGRSRTVLVVGVEKMSDVSGAEAGAILGRASYVAQEGSIPSFAHVFAEIANSYVRKFGDVSEALAQIAEKNHRNGLLNPLAHLHRKLTLEECLQVSESNPTVAGPLKRSDCSPISDGAAAIVLRAGDDLGGVARAICVRARSQVNDYLPMSRRDMWRLQGCERAWNNALEQARLTLRDLHLVESHDCFTIAELMQYEAMGLVPPGHGKKALAEGWTQRDGLLPVNVSGGLKSKGHPIGATGVSMHVMAAKQLAGEAGEAQLGNANLAGVFNMGGTGVANYASVLERIV
ncbi:acetyl-CoA acetyltransferase [Pseudomaricurvus alkylphenolicus]|uniref:acetyl-CoA acetyltransferase n=1 Tax=Pseudomaricurvus alkylphenolicus TaxID=1306991 RepID=UPI001422B3A8|nr:acetyl-CoA acetyltransferase [Pseudomaricurvus alkylphenolicus]NIB38586.1 acetyl-CoA acetyltransferase [Pseudomaricurvus alkylphenolicus]